MKVAKGKVYINIKRAISEYNKDKQKPITRLDISEFVFSKQGISAHSKRTKLSRKLVEDSKYELTLTEAYNVSVFLELDFSEFIKKYTKAI